MGKRINRVTDSRCNYKYQYEQVILIISLYNKHTYHSLLTRKTIRITGNDLFRSPFFKSPPPQKKKNAFHGSSVVFELRRETSGENVNGRDDFNTAAAGDGLGESIYSWWYYTRRANVVLSVRMSNTLNSKSKKKGETGGRRVRR